MGIIDYLTIALIIVAIILGIYLIFALKQILQNLNKIRQDVHDLYERSLPLIEEADQSLKKVNQLSEEANQQFSKLLDFYENVKENYYRIREKIEHSKTENPAYDLYKNLTAMSKGFSTFWNKLRNK